MAGVRSIELAMPTPRPGSRRCDPRPACWLVTVICENWLRVNWCRTGRLNRYPDGSRWNIRPTRACVSHETIYRSLFIQARGALKQELVQHLRSKRRVRRSRHASVHGHSQGRIVDAISIRERPAEVEDRAIPGHWEGDLLRGARHSHVATLVERHSRFCMLVRCPARTPRRW